MLDGVTCLRGPRVVPFGSQYLGAEPTRIGARGGRFALRFRSLPKLFGMRNDEKCEVKSTSVASFQDPSSVGAQATPRRSTRLASCGSAWPATQLPSKCLDRDCSDLGLFRAVRSPTLAEALALPKAIGNEMK